MSSSILNEVIYSSQSDTWHKISVSYINCKTICKHWVDGLQDLVSGGYLQAQRWPSSDRVYHDDVIKWKHFPRHWPLCGEFTGDRWIPAQGSVTRSLDVFCLNKLLSKQSWGWWFETLSHPLWRHSNDTGPELQELITLWFISSVCFRCVKRQKKRPWDIPRLINELCSPGTFLFSPGCSQWLVNTTLFHKEWHTCCSSSNICLRD